MNRSLASLVFSSAALLLLLLGASLLESASAFSTAPATTRSKSSDSRRSSSLMPLRSGGLLSSDDFYCLSQPECDEGTASGRGIKKAGTSDANAYNYEFGHEERTLLSNQQHEWIPKSQIVEDAYIGDRKIEDKTTLQFTKFLARCIDQFKSAKMMTQMSLAMLIMGLSEVLDGGAVRASAVMKSVRRRPRVGLFGRSKRQP